MTKTRSSYFKKAVSLLLVLVMMISIVPLAEITVSSATMDISEVSANVTHHIYQQTDSKWSKYPYGSGGTITNNIANKGCGVLATVNAVEYLTGNFINPKTFADWAMKSGQYTSGVGSNVDIAKNSVNKFGNDYGYKLDKYYSIVSNVNTKSGWCGCDTCGANQGYPKTKSDMQKVWNELVTRLKTGDTCVTLVAHHFVAIVDYDSGKDKVLVYDSAAAAREKRNGTSPKVDASKNWKSMNELWWGSSEGSKHCKIRYMMTFLKATKKTTYTVTTNAYSSKTNTTAVISSKVSPEAVVRNWGYFLSTDKSKVEKVDGTNNKTHENKGNLIYQRALPDDKIDKKMTTLKDVTISGLTPGTTYYYKFCVKVNGNWIDTPKKEIKSFTTDKNPPSKPSISMNDKYADIGTNGLGGGGDAVTVTWSSVSGANGFRLNQLNGSKESTGKYKDNIAKGATSCSCDASWFNTPGTYYLQLLAKNEAGSSVSNEVKVTVHPNVNVVFYDTVSKTNITGSQSIPYGTSAVAPSNPSQTGYTFKGWDKSFDNVKSDITVNTLYEANYYTVKFVDGNNNQVLESKKFVFGSTLKESDYPEAPTHKYHAFLGWSEPEYTVRAETHTITASYEWDLPTDIGTSIESVELATWDNAEKDENGNVINDGYKVTVQVEAKQNVTKTIKGRVIVALKSATGRLLIETESAAFVLYPNGIGSVTKNIEVFVPYEATNKELASVVEAYVVNNYSSAGIISVVDIDSEKINEANRGKWRYTSDPTFLNTSGIETDTTKDYVTYDLKTVTLKESYATSLAGYEQLSSRWVQTSSGTIDFVKNWPKLGNSTGVQSEGTSGSQYNNGEYANAGRILYSWWNVTPKSARETATTRTRIIDEVSKGAIYYHWCANRNNGNLNHNVTSHKYIADKTSGNYYWHFHAFFYNAQDDVKGQKTYTYYPEFKQYFYERDVSKSSREDWLDPCTDSKYWTSRVPVYTQTWAEDTKLFTYRKTEVQSGIKVNDIDSVPEFDNANPSVIKTAENVTQWYAYRAEIQEVSEDKNAYDINVPVGDIYNNREVTVYVYKDKQASDYTTEYIGAATTSNGRLVINGAQMREACDENTGDFTIAIAIPGETNAVVVGTIVADKPTYTVTYYDYDGTVIYQQKVPEGSTVETPDESLLHVPEGYKFSGWTLSTVGVNRQLDITPLKEQIVCKVTFIDWQNYSVWTAKLPYGAEIEAYFPDIADADDTVATWDISNCTTEIRTTDAVDLETNAVTQTEYEAHIVTTDLVITTFVDKKKLSVSFTGIIAPPEPEDEISEDDKILTEVVEYGDSVATPSAIEDDEDIIFYGWKNIETGEYLDCTKVVASGTYYPVYEFANTVETPTASVTTGEYTSDQTVTLTCETENAVIYYSTDGSDPAYDDVNGDAADPSGVHEYTGPITLTKTTTLKFCAMAMGMNNSGTVAELYAINTATSGVKYHLVTVYSNLPQDEGAYYQALIKDSTRFNTTVFGDLEGYSYEGLFYDAEGEDEFFASEQITAETVLYAIYTPHTYTATFNDYDGTFISSDTVDYATAAQAPVPTREGYVFIGWDSDDYEYMTADKTFTAQYCLESEYATVKLTRTTLTVSEDDLSITLKAKVSPDELSGTELLWETNNSDVVDVDQTGKLTFLAEGSATITVTVVATGEYSECFVTVNRSYDKHIVLAGGAILDIDAQGFLRRIPNGKNSVAELIGQFANDESKLSFYSPSEVLIAGADLVGTGSVIKLIDGETLLDQITAIMTGDFNGDGIVNTRDVSMMSQNVLQMRDANEIQAIAVDVNGDGDVNVRDCAMMSRYLAGKEDLV